MKSKLRASWFSAFIVLGAAAAPAGVCSAAPASASPAPARQTVVTGKVVMPDGHPAVGTKVIVTRYDPDNHALVSTTPGQVGHDGTGDFRISEDLRPLNAAEARGEAVTGTLVAYAPGLIGFGYPGQKAAIKLIPTTAVRVRVVDSGGKPLAGVVLAPWYVYYQDANDSDYNFVFLPPDLTARMRQRTDASGWATFTGLPQGYEARLHVADLRFAQLSNPSDFQLAAAPRTPDAAVTLTPAGVINGQAVFAGAAHRPSANVPVVVSMQNGDNHQAVTDAQGRFHVGQLAQGSYNIVANLGFTKLAADWTAQALTGRYVTAGHPTNVGTMRLEHGGLLTVRVTNIATGAPLSGIPIAIDGPSNANGAGLPQSYSTNAAGIYRVHLPAGSQRVYTAVSGAQDSETVIIADGESKTINFKLVSQTTALADWHCGELQR